MIHRLLPAALAATVLGLLAGLPAQDLRTPAEATDYQNGGTLYGPLMEFVYELESRSDLMSVRVITETLMGRDVVLCSLSNPPVRRPADVLNTGKPIVLIVNNVHGGEVAGKDASMALMRDLIFGDLRPLLDEVVVLVVPTINPDGAEVRRRTNEQGLDMNRDYLKQESQEIGALVTEVMNKWQPQLHIDTHHGGSAPYTLVYQTCMNPAGDAELIRFGNEEILPNVRQALRDEDYDGFWYTGPRQQEDGTWAWRPTSVEARKQHVYCTLSNIVGFLFESPSSSHRIRDNGTRVVSNPPTERYQHQVRGQYLGLREMVRFAAQRGDELVQVVANAKRRATMNGSVVSKGDQIPLEYRQIEKFKDDFWVRDADSESGYSLVNGSVQTKFVATKTTTRPFGYLLPPEMAIVIPHLLDHEISVKVLTEPLTATVDGLYASEVREAQYYQGHYLKDVTVVVQTEERTFPTGSFFVPMAQPKSNLIGILLEPETEDSLASWNYLDYFIQVRGGGRGQTAGGGQRGRRGQAAAAAGQRGRGRGQGRGRGGRGFGGRGRGRGGPGQSTRTYRLMEEIDIRGILIDHVDNIPKNRYVGK